MKAKLGVTLITLQYIARVGWLEFDYAFLTCMASKGGICPHMRSISEEKGIEEERRLVYVWRCRRRCAKIPDDHAGMLKIAGTGGNEQREAMASRRRKCRGLAEIPSAPVDTAARASMAGDWRDAAAMSR